MHRRRDQRPAFDLRCGPNRQTLCLGFRLERLSSLAAISSGDDDAATALFR